MPTYSFSRTREQLRDMVLRKLRVLQDGESVEASDAVIVYEAMDVLLKELHARGTLWFNVAGSTTDIALVGGTATVSAASDVLYPLTVKIRVGTEDVDVEIIGHRQYQAIPDKTEQGEPEVVFFSGGVYTFWPVPDSNYTGKTTYQQIAADTAASTAPDVLVSMLHAMRDILVHRLADDFQEQNEGRIQRWANEAEMGQRTIRALNAEPAHTATVTAEYF